MVDRIKKILISDSSYYVSLIMVATSENKDGIHLYGDTIVFGGTLCKMAGEGAGSNGGGLIKFYPDDNYSGIQIIVPKERLVNASFEP